MTMQSVPLSAKRAGRRGKTQGNPRGKKELSPLEQQVQTMLQENRTQTAADAAPENAQRLLEHLEEILKGATDGITLQATDGKLLFANAAGARIIGFDSPKELLETPVEEVMRRFLVLEEDGMPMPLSRLPSRRALDGERVEGALLRFRVLKTKEERWARTTSFPVKNPAGGILYIVNFFHEVTEEMRSQRAQKFIAHAARVLSSSLDYETTLATVAQLIVPDVADWSSVHILEEEGSIRQLAVAHVDPQKVEWARQLGQRYPADYSAPQGIGEVLRTGKAEMLSDISPALIEAVARDARHLQMLRMLQLRSYMIVPMTARGRTLGAITFMSAESGHLYGEADLLLANDLAQHAAIAVDNARLYREATRRGEEIRQLNGELERKVRERTSELAIAQEHDRANLQRLKDIIGSMSIAAVASDENLQILHTNERFCRLFGLGAPEDIIGKSGLEVIEKATQMFADPAPHAQALLDILQERKPAMNRELQLKDGRFLSGDYIPIFDGEVHRGHMLLYRDITREKRVDRAKSEFMSLASHQLRTPLTVIRWALGRLVKTVEPSQETTLRLAGAAKSAAENMAETINAMLLISRIEAEKIHLKFENVNLARLCTSLRDTCLEESAAKKQLFRVECDPLLTLCTDERLLREILLNLLRNAIKYTREGGVITLSASLEDGAVSLAVCDTGFGIPLQEQHKVFKKFFRARNAVEQDPNGTGLGLYLASITARLLKATLTFVSQEAHGTTFKLRFPSPSAS